MDSPAGTPSVNGPRNVPTSVEETILQALQRINRSLDEAEARLNRPREKVPEAPTERRLYVGEPRAFSVPQQRADE